MNPLKTKTDHTHRHTRAFTLLEMLLIIAIIAILAGIVIVAINSGRQLAQARNAQRASDLRAIHSAVNQYYIDNLQWPGDLETTTELTEICNTGTESEGHSIDCTTDGLIDLSSLVPTYLSAIPTDPQGSITSSIPFTKQVYAQSTGTGYKIAIKPTSQTVMLTAPNSVEYGFDLISINFIDQEVAIDEGNFVYVAGDDGIIRKVNVDTGVIIRESEAYGTVVKSLKISGNSIYAVGDEAVSRIKKYNLNTLEFENESNSLGERINSIDIDENFIYISTDDRVYKYNLGDLSYTGVSGVVLEAQSGGNIFASDTQVHDNFIYVRNLHGSITKLLKTDLSFAAQSPFMASNNNSQNMVIDSEYIYVSNGSRVQRYRKDNLNYVSQRSENTWVHWMSKYNDKMYVPIFSGDTSLRWRVIRYNLNNFSFSNPNDLSPVNITSLWRIHADQFGIYTTRTGSNILYILDFSTMETKFQVNVITTDTQAITSNNN